MYSWQKTPLKCEISITIKAIFLTAYSQWCSLSGFNTHVVVCKGGRISLIFAFSLTLKATFWFELLKSWFKIHVSVFIDSCQKTTLTFEMNINVQAVFPLTASLCWFLRGLKTHVTLWTAGRKLQYFCVIRISI